MPDPNRAGDRDRGRDRDRRRVMDGRDGDTIRSSQICRAGMARGSGDAEGISGK